MNYDALQKLGLDVKRIKKKVSKQNSASAKVSREILLVQAKQDIIKYNDESIKTRKKFFDSDEINKKELEDIDNLLLHINNFLKISTGEDLENLQKEQEKYINMKENIKKITKRKVK